MASGSVIEIRTILGMDEEVDSVVGFFLGLVNFFVVFRCSVYLIGHRILESIFKSKICSFFSVVVREGSLILSLSSHRKEKESETPQRAAENKENQ